MAQEQKIKGAVRFGGRVYKEGQEAELKAATDAAGVDARRAYGVASTEAVPGKQSGPKARAAALAKQRGKSADAPGQNFEGADAILETSIADLPAAIAEINDIGALRKLTRRDQRTTSKAIYAARIEEIKAEEAAAESGEGAE